MNIAGVPRQILARADERFELRPYEDGFLAAIFEAADESRGHISPWMGWLTHDYGETHCRDWITEAIRNWEDGTGCEFVIFDRTDGQVVGCCGLNFINRKDLVCNLGYWVRASKLRLGAARAATMLLRDFGLQTLGLNRLEIVAAVGNRPSQRVAESVGALFEGVQHQRLRVGETVHDAHMYALLKSR